MREKLYALYRSPYDTLAFKHVDVQNVFEVFYLAGQKQIVCTSFSGFGR